MTAVTCVVHRTAVTKKAATKLTLNREFPCSFFLMFKLSEITGFPLRQVRIDMRRVRICRLNRRKCKNFVTKNLGRAIPHTSTLSFRSRWCLETNRHQTVGWLCHQSLASRRSRPNVLKRYEVASKSAKLPCHKSKCHKTSKSVVDDTRPVCQIPTVTGADDATTSPYCVRRSTTWRISTPSPRFPCLLPQLTSRR